MDIHIVSGFSGAGKTSFLNKYLPLLSGKTAVIENESGEVKLDNRVISTDIPVKELAAGCICCNLAMDLRRAIRECADLYQPDHIVMEPSGVGRLSDVVGACRRAGEREGAYLRITKLITVVDVSCYEECKDGFGAFYLDQIQHAGLLLPSHLDEITKEEKPRILEDMRKQNPEAMICERDFRELTESELAALMRQVKNYEEKPVKKVYRSARQIQYTPAAGRKIRFEKYGK